MSNYQTIKFPRSSDRTVIEAFKSLTTDKSGAINLTGTAIGGINLGIFSLTAEPSEEWKALLKHNSALLENLSLTIAGLSLVYYRGGSKGPDEKSPIFDEIRIYFNENVGGVSVEDRLALVAILNKKLKAFDPARTMPGSVSEESKQLEALHQSTLERLEQLAEDVIHKSTDFRINLEQQHADKLQKLEAALATRKEELETRHNVELSILKEKENALATKLVAIDDRNNTHVRREIRDRMLDDVKNRIQDFGVSRATTSKRQPVLIGIVVLAMSLALLLSLSFLELKSYRKTLEGPGLFDQLIGSASSAINNPNTTVNQYRPEAGLTYLYLLLARIALLTLGFVATLLYYIRWQNKWAEQHSISEFQLQQFYIDVNRANWAIESGLEWRKETDSEIPEMLLSSITKNLFSTQSEPETVLHPADELASALMGSASKVKLRVGENELDFDRPRKIPKTVPSVASE